MSKYKYPYLDCFFLLACSMEVGDGAFRIILKPLKCITGIAGKWYKIFCRDLSCVATMYL